MSKKRQKIKPVIFENITSKEKYLCDNPRNVVLIDGVEFIEVYSESNARKHLMRKAALQRVKLAD